MSIEDKGRELLSRLRREMNGAVAGSMAARGLNYGINYGVSISGIRAVARDFAPDHLLAMHIYGPDIRETRLAAYLIADPARVTVGELDFWGEGITTAELGSNAALSFFSKSPAAGEIIFHWLGNGTPPMLMFAALMTAAGNLLHGQGNVEWDWGEVLDLIYDRAQEDKEPGSKALLSEGLAALLLRVISLGTMDNRAFDAYVARIAPVNPALASYLQDEISWWFA